MAEFVLEYLKKSKAQLFKLKGLPCGDFGIINVCAPNNPINRGNVWETIKEEVSRDCFWLLCDDLNMVEGKKTNPLFMGS